MPTARSRYTTLSVLAMIAFAVAPAAAQTAQVAGTVRDQTGAPLPSATHGPARMPTWK